MIDIYSNHFCHDFIFKILVKLLIPAPDAEYYNSELLYVSQAYYFNCIIAIEVIQPLMLVIMVNFKDMFKTSQTNPIKGRFLSKTIPTST